MYRNKLPPPPGFADVSKVSPSAQYDVDAMRYKRLPGLPGLGRVISTTTTRHRGWGGGKDYYSETLVVPNVPNE
jgi:hypothetical protein